MLLNFPNSLLHCTTIGLGFEFLDQLNWYLMQTVQDKRVVYGGGWPEIRMAKAVESLAAATPGKKSLAMESFARALRAIPFIIADNAGLDASDVVSNLRAAHVDDNSKAGIDINLGVAGNMETLGVYESFRVKNQVLLSATEAAEMIIRVDEIVKCAPRPRNEN